MLTLINTIAEKNGLRKSGARFTGPCPECGGSAKSEKFSLYIDGGYRCFACGFKGDLISWLRKKESMSCPEAHEAAGLPCRFAECAVRGTCRMGDGSGKKAKKTIRTIEPQAGKQEKELPLTMVKSPAALWRQWAEEMAEKSVARLQEKKDVLAWLDKRGISAETADQYGLGWLDHDRRVNRASIGLAPRNGKKELWVPGGLLISIYDDNQIHRLRVRRTEEARNKFLPDLKYLWLEGSGTEPLTLNPSGLIRGAVIVEAELDGIAVAAAHNQVLVVALGTVSAGLPQQLVNILDKVPVILVALDADPGKDGKQGAGPAAIARWQNRFRQAKFYPVPQGKDPGHYAELGGSLRAWVESGLLPEVTTSVAQKRHDLPLSPVLETSGDGGKDILSSPPEIKSGVEVVKDLKYCSICLGNRFIAADAGGYFCIECQPVSMPGHLVMAGKSRGHYAVS